MWESQVLLTDGQVVFSGYSGFRPPSMNDRLDISEIFLKGPLNPSQKKKRSVLMLICIISHRSLNCMKFISLV